MNPRDPFTWGYVPPADDAVSAPEPVEPEPVEPEPVEPEPVEPEPVEPEPVEPEPVEPEPVAEPAAWVDARTHAAVDEAVPDGVELPEDWDGMTIADKKAWLGDNA
jgi:hypothetical protein